MRMRYIILIAILISVIIILFPLPDIYAQPDAHDIWVVECREAHAYNMSWSLASGFWYEPDLSDISNPVMWHPSEDPNTVPHGSVIACTDGEPSLTLMYKTIPIAFILLLVYIMYYRKKVPMNSD
jgi:hypothetical protein